MAAASTRFWLFAELTYVEEHIPQSEEHTHGSEVCKSPSPFTSFP